MGGPAALRQDATPADTVEPDRVNMYDRWESGDTLADFHAVANPPELDVEMLGFAPDCPACELRPACALEAVWALLMEAVRAEAPASVAGALQDRHSDSSPRVGEVTLATHARMP